MRPIVYPSAVAGYALAVGATAAALGLALPLWAAFQLSAFLLFLCAVMLSAYGGGTRAGLLATLLSTVAINYFFELPAYSLEIVTVDTLVKLLVFLGTALLISALTERMRGAELRAEQARAAAEAARVQAEVSQQRLEHILARVGDALFAVDAEWRVTYASPHTAMVILSYRGPLTAEALVGRRLWDIWDESKSARVAARFREAMATQTPVEFDEYDALVDRWVTFRAFPSTDGLSVYCHDATAAKRSGEQLRSIVFVAQEVGKTLNHVLPAAQDTMHRLSEADLPAAAREDVVQIGQQLDTVTERIGRLERVVQRATTPNQPH